MPVTDTRKITDALKDAAYVTIGFGVLSFQKAQVRRQELTKQLEAQIAAGRKNATELATQLDTYVAPLRSQLESGLSSVEELLPPQAQEALKSVREALVDQERFLRHRFGRAA
jgi:hypothetical protein